MSARPADEARRALREARERAARERAAAQPPDPVTPAPQDPPRSGGADTGGEAPRPGEIAREALRAQGGDERGSAPDERTRHGDDERASSALGDEPARSEPRAADVAREALRAARDDARRARQETEREGARRRRRARRSTVDDRAAAVRRVRTDTTAPAARDMRQLLSDAFRMPDPPERPDVPARPDADPSRRPDVPDRQALGLPEGSGVPGGGDLDLPERSDVPHRPDADPSRRPEVPDRQALGLPEGSGVPGGGDSGLPERSDVPHRPDADPSRRPGARDREALGLPEGSGVPGGGDLDLPERSDVPHRPDADPSRRPGARDREALGLPEGSGVPGGGDLDLPERSDVPDRRARELSDTPDGPGPRGVDAGTASEAIDAPALRETDPAPYADGPATPAPSTAPAHAGSRDPEYPDTRSTATAPEHPRPHDPEGPGTRGPTPAPAYARPRDPQSPAPGRTAPRPPYAARATSAPATPRSSGRSPSAGSSGAGSRRSMAAPDRDGDLRRTFPPFPPREGETFAASWWGNAWVSALEQGALDSKRLERGRGYAEHGNVDAITVTPGLVLAYVQGSRPRPYRVQVRLRTLGDADWDRFLDAAADRPGHIAALLDKEMPQSLADCGVPLLPGPGDLEPHCSCPDRGHPCKHAAALCYQTARLLDADPFVLLLLRGRGERELLDALSRLSATRAARAAQDKEPAPAPGVRATEVLAAGTRPPLPAPLPVPPHPEQPPAYPASPGGPDPFALDQLATDAAARAHALLTTGRDPVGELTFWQDAVRLAAARPGSGLTAGSRALYASLASAAGRSVADLARAVAAWRQGGPEGLAVLEEPWDPPAGRFDRARPLLLAADLPAFRPWRNHLTHPRGHIQLRLGRDGLWYAYESEPGREDWWPRGTPDLDPVGALTGLGAPGDV